MLVSTEWAFPGFLDSVGCKGCLGRSVHAQWSAYFASWNWDLPKKGCELSQASSSKCRACSSPATWASDLIFRSSALPGHRIPSLLLATHMESGLMVCPGALSETGIKADIQNKEHRHHPHRTTKAIKSWTRTCVATEGRQVFLVAFVSLTAW